MTGENSKSNLGLPRSVWALGFVSTFMDISSEMILGLLPVYLVTVLGTSTLTVGVIEGIAESTANITKIFSGALSDWLGNRKLLTALGYGLAAITKPSSRWPQRPAGCLQLGSLIGSARACGVPLGMRSSRILHRPI
jgi:sugar phosphate permease